MIFSKANNFVLWAGAGPLNSHLGCRGRKAAGCSRGWCQLLRSLTEDLHTFNNSVSTQRYPQSRTNVSLPIQFTCGNKAVVITAVVWLHQRCAMANLWLPGILYLKLSKKKNLFFGKIYVFERLRDSAWENLLSAGSLPRSPTWVARAGALPFQLPACCPVLPSWCAVAE